MDENLVNKGVIGQFLAVVVSGQPKIYSFSIVQFPSLLLDLAKIPDFFGKMAISAM